MITIMKANEMMPSWAIENCTPVVLAIMKVAAAVPGPQITRAAVPRNSAARRLEKVTSAMRSAQNSHRNGSHGTSPPSGCGEWVRQCSVEPNNVSLSFRRDEGHVNSRVPSWPGFTREPACVPGRKRTPTLLRLRESRSADGSEVGPEVYHPERRSEGCL